MKLLIASLTLMLCACGLENKYRLLCELEGTPTMSSSLAGLIWYEDGVYHISISPQATYIYTPRQGEACKIETASKTP